MQSEVACNSWIALLETTQPGTDWTVAGVETRLEEKQHRENSQSRQVCMCGYYSPLNSKMCWKHLLACPCQATCNGQFKNLCTAFNEIWYWEVLPKLVYTFQLLLQSDSINSYCTCFSVCLKVFSDVRGLSTVNKLFADINMIVFLIFTQQMWHRFGCNTMYAQIFGENLMTWFFLNSDFLCYFMNSETMIGMKHFPYFLDIFFISWCWRLSWTFIILIWSPALFKTLPVHSV